MSQFQHNYDSFFESYSPNKQKQQPQRQNNYKRTKKKKRHLKPWVKLGFAVIALTLIVVLISVNISKCSNVPLTIGSPSSTISLTSTEQVTVKPVVENASPASYTITLGSQIDSSHAVLVETDSNTILAQRNANSIIYPASMTKVMTLLVAVEEIESSNSKSYQDLFKMTSAIIDPLYREEATLCGFSPNEEVTIKDMLYGMILESGAEAAVGLAIYIAGSEEEFVKLMNQKANELKLKDTHFTNVSGLHSAEHYTTCVEMVTIMNAAISNEFCREVLSTEYYTVKANSFHEDINFHSTMFSRMYGTEPKVATILGGKTGYTIVSGNCLVSYAKTDDNREIICVTAEGGGKYIPIYDCIKLYKEYSHIEK